MIFIFCQGAEGWIIQRLCCWVKPMPLYHLCVLLFHSYIALPFNLVAVKEADRFYYLKIWAVFSIVSNDFSISCLIIWCTIAHSSFFLLSFLSLFLNILINSDLRCGRRSQMLGKMIQRYRGSRRYTSLRERKHTEKEWSASVTK